MTTVVSNAHKTKPAKYQDIDDSDFADQAGWRYPCDTEAHCRAALAYIQKPNDQQQYTPETLAKIKAFIKKKAKAFGIDVAAFAELSHNDTRDKVAAALGIDGYWIHDLYGDDAAGTAIHRKIKLAGERLRRRWQALFHAVYHSKRRGDAGRSHGSHAPHRL